MPTSPIKDAILVTKDTFNNARVIQANEKITLAAGGVWSYPIVLDPLEYDLTLTEISVSMLDEDIASPTFEYYIKAPATVVVGWKEDGSLRVVNNHTDPLSLVIRAVAYHIPAA